MESPDLINNIKLFDNPETIEKLVREFSEIINNKTKSQVIRSVAADQLKNAIYTNDETTSAIKYKDKWIKFSSETRSYVKANTLGALEFDTNRPSIIADLIAHIVCIEMSKGDKSISETISKLIDNMTKEANSSDVLLETTSEALSLICRDVEDINQISPFVDRLLDLVRIYVLDQAGPSANEFVKTSVLSMLHASDSFMSFLIQNKKKELDSIIEATLDKNQANDVIKISGLKLLEVYITSSGLSSPFIINDQTLQLTLELVKSENKELAIQATHFWIHLLKKQIKSEGDGEKNLKIISDETLSDLARRIKESLLPVLFQNLTEQTELEEDDEMTVFKSASICLLLCTQYLQDEMISPLADFMNDHLDLSKSWQELDASLICLGASFKQHRNLERLKGELLEQKLDILRGMLASAHLDSNVFATNEACRDTCESLIYLICKILPEYQDRFENMISEFRVRSFKFFLFNKNLLLDWSDNFKTISFNRDKVYKVDFQEKNSKFGSDVVSIASSVVPEAKVDKTALLISPPKQPMINLSELHTALNRLKKIRNYSDENEDPVVSSEESDTRRGSVFERQETIRNCTNEYHDDTATPTNEPTELDQAFEEEVKQSPDDSNTEKEPSVMADLEIINEPKQPEIQPIQPVEVRAERAEKSTSQVNQEQEEDPVEKLHRMYKQQQSPEAKEVPAFLLVKLKHVKPPPD